MVDPRQVAFSCLAKRKRPKKRRPRMAQTASALHPKRLRCSKPRHTGTQTAKNLAVSIRPLEITSVTLIAVCFYWEYSTRSYSQTCSDLPSTHKSRFVHRLPRGSANQLKKFPVQKTSQLQLDIEPPQYRHRNEIENDHDRDRGRQPEIETASLFDEPGKRDEQR